jgi:uncharacterized membrane-anchored protein YhcB (DUF1043 family)
VLQAAAQVKSTFAPTIAFLGVVIGAAWIAFTYASKIDENGKKTDELSDKLGKKTDELNDKLGKKMDELNDKLGKKTDELKDKLGKKTDELNVELGKKMDELKAAIQQAEKSNAAAISNAVRLVREEAHADRAFFFQQQPNANAAGRRMPRVGRRRRARP